MLRVANIDNLAPILVEYLYFSRYYTDDLAHKPPTRITQIRLIVQRTTILQHVPLSDTDTLTDTLTGTLTGVYVPW